MPPKKKAPAKPKASASTPASKDMPQKAPVAKKAAVDKAAATKNPAESTKAVNASVDVNSKGHRNGKSSIPDTKCKSVDKNQHGSDDSEDDECDPPMCMSSPKGSKRPAQHGSDSSEDEFDPPMCMSSPKGSKRPVSTTEHPESQAPASKRVKGVNTAISRPLSGTGSVSAPEAVENTVEKLPAESENGVDSHQPAAPQELSIESAPTAVAQEGPTMIPRPCVACSKSRVLCDKQASCRRCHTKGIKCQPQFKIVDGSIAKKSIKRTKKVTPPETTRATRQNTTKVTQSNGTCPSRIEPTTKDQGAAVAPGAPRSGDSTLGAAIERPTTPENDRGPMSPRFPSPPEERATLKDKENWQGWCELESDPQYFSAMIREMGVRGVSVRDVCGVETVESLMMLPMPIYGLILLYRYRDSNPAEQEKRCPEKVWFANQLPAQNSCSTLAMVNILMNTDVELGEHLQQFKDFTSGFTPFSRGEAFASFQFVKRIHNSFAKKMDMLEDDKYLAYKVKRNTTSGRRGSGDSDHTVASQDNFEDNACHFIAYLPVDGKVWKLDGMDRQPTCLGEYDTAERDSWLEVARERISSFIQAAEDPTYNVLALVQSPVIGLRKDLCTTRATIQFIESCLDGVEKDWREFIVSDGSDAPTHPVEVDVLNAMGVSQEQLASTQISDADKDSLKSMDVTTLIARREAALKEQHNITGQIINEMNDEAAEDSSAKARQWDYGPVVQKWLELLANNGFLQQNLDRFRQR